LEQGLPENDPREGHCFELEQGQLNTTDVKVVVSSWNRGYVKTIRVKVIVSSLNKAHVNTTGVKVIVSS
jgi:hypothetical protein